MQANSARKTKIAVFGSAFNPPSLGHKSVIDSLSHFDRVILVPSISHAWGKNMLDYSTRCEMLELFIKDLSLENVEYSTIEARLHQPGESVTTYALLDELQKQHPEAEITFVIGPDNLFNFHKFYKSEAILAQWAVMACPEKVAVRSTQIRENLQNLRPVAELTTPSVEKFLINNKIY